MTRGSGAVGLHARRRALRRDVGAAARARRLGRSSWAVDVANHGSDQTTWEQFGRVPRDRWFTIGRIQGNRVYLKCNP